MLWQMNDDYKDKRLALRIKMAEMAIELEEKRAEILSKDQILHFILENATDGFWDWNILTGEEYLSPRFKQQLGFEDDEMENTPEAWMKLADPDDMKSMEKALSEHFVSKGETIVRQIIKFTHRDGHTLKILCRGKVIEWGEFDELCRMVGTHTILT